MTTASPLRRSVTVVWKSPKGAGCMRVFDDPDKLWAFLDKLRCKAIVRNAQGEEVGGVADMGHAHLDDRRRRWNPWFDRDEVG